MENKLTELLKNKSDHLQPGIRGQVREDTTNDPALPPRRPPARTPDRPPPPIPQHEPLFWDRPVQDVEEDDDIENMPCKSVFLTKRTCTLKLALI